MEASIQPLQRQEQTKPTACPTGHRVMTTDLDLILTACPDELRPRRTSGFARLSLDVILNALRTFQDDRPPDRAHDNPSSRRRRHEERDAAKHFLEGDMEPFATLAHLDVQSVQWRTLLRSLDLTPYTEEFKTQKEN